MLTHINIIIINKGVLLRFVYHLYELMWLQKQRKLWFTQRELSVYRFTDRESEVNSKSVGTHPCWMSVGAFCPVDLIPGGFYRSCGFVCVRNMIRSEIRYQMEHKGVSKSQVVTQDKKKYECCQTVGPV